MNDVAAVMRLVPHQPVYLDGAPECVVCRQAHAVLVAIATEEKADG